MIERSIPKYNPLSELVVKKHEISNPAFPAVDFHTHYTFELLNKPFRESLDEAVVKLREAGLFAVINLWSFWGKELEEIIKFTQDYDIKFITFGSVDVSKVDNPDFSEYARNIIIDGYKKGMRGLKFFKDFGLKIRGEDGKLLKIDDERFSPIWNTAAELKIPVLIHVADPKAFFKPIDENNERLDSLSIHPEWSFYGDEYPSYERLMEMQENLIRNNPDTTFVIAHLGSSGENLGFVSQQLDRYKNIYIDTAARLSELGRQPYTARDFLIKYQDRVLFGTDASPVFFRHKYYYRFFETWDEYFDYAEDCTQGRWKIYGVGLPNTVLEKIYYKNAVKLVPEISTNDS